MTPPQVPQRNVQEVYNPVSEQVEVLKELKEAGVRLLLASCKVRAPGHAPRAGDARARARARAHARARARAHGHAHARARARAPARARAYGHAHVRAHACAHGCADAVGAWFLRGRYQGALAFYKGEHF